MAERQPLWAPQTSEYAQTVPVAIWSPEQRAAAEERMRQDAAREAFWRAQRVRPQSRSEQMLANVATPGPGGVHTQGLIGPGMAPGMGGPQDEDPNNWATPPQMAVPGTNLALAALRRRAAAGGDLVQEYPRLVGTVR